MAYLVNLDYFCATFFFSLFLPLQLPSGSAALGIHVRVCFGCFIFVVWLFVGFFVFLGFFC